MKKLIGVIFALAVMTGCGSTETTDSGDLTGGAAGGAGSATSMGAGEGSGVDGSMMGEDGAAGSLPTVFYFEFDQSTLTAETRAALDVHAGRLRNSNGPVRLEGHADERGTREYNLALGERRANAVANYLALQGVPRAQIESVSYGEERPVSMGQDEQSMSQNRRVELK